MAARRVRRRKGRRPHNTFMSDSTPFLSRCTTVKQFQDQDSPIFRVPSINLQNPFPLPGRNLFTQKPFEATQLRNQYSRPFRQIPTSSSNDWSYERIWDQVPACMPAFGTMPQTWGNNLYSPPIQNSQNFAFGPRNNFVPNYWFSNAGSFGTSGQANNTNFPPASSYQITNRSDGRLFKSSNNAASSKSATSTSRNCDNMSANRNYSGVKKNNVSKSDTSSVSNVKSEVTSGNKDDDVTYLFSVDSTPSGLLVEEINLADDPNRTVSTANSTSVTQSNNDAIQTPSISSSKTSDASNSRPSRKRKTSRTNENSTKRSNTDQFIPRCSVCEIHYDSLVGDNKHICIGDCGHMFCQRCIRKSENKVCKTCNARNLKFRKLYL